MPNRRFMLVRPKRRRSLDNKEDGKNSKKLALPKRLDHKDALERLLLHTTLETQVRLPHHLLPTFNVGQWPMERCEDLREHTKYALSVPRPVYVARKHCAHVDICYKRPTLRFLYRKRLFLNRTLYHDKHKKQKQIRALEKDNTYHINFFEMAERLERNPDPYFYGTYDYYYSGGNVCALPDEEQVLLHVDGVDLRNLNISRFRRKSDFSKSSLKPLCSKDFDSVSEIFEVIPLRHLRQNRPNCFAVRQRNAISLASLQPDDTIKPITVFKTNSTPFISMAQSPHDLNMFVVTTMKQHVRWYDLNRPAPTLRKLYELTDSEPICWNTVKAWQEHTYLYANEKKLCLMDVRTTPEEWLKSTWGFHEQEFGCELISALAASGFSNLVYVATSHKLHCLDMRYMGRHFEERGSAGSVVRWTHQLEYAPAFIDTYRSGKTETIALASPKAGDLCICELSRKKNIEKLTLNADAKLSKNIYRSYVLPYQPPTLQEAYESARLAGKCLQPDADLKNRLECCTTGLSFYNGSEADSSQRQLVTSNSNGDVYAHTMTEREESQAPEQRTNEASDEMMSDFARKICARIPPAPLNYTDVVDLRALSKVFRCSALNNLKEEEDDPDAVEKTNGFTESAETKPEVPAHKRRGLGRWQKSMSVLHSYKDALVPDLLAIWDIDYLEEKEIKISHLNEKLRIKPDPDALVSSWLTANVADRPMTSIPRDVLNGSFKLNNSNVSFDQNDTLMEDLSQTLGSLAPQIHSTQIADDIIGQMDASALNMKQNYTLNEWRDRPKSIKKKSKYVQGF